MTSAEQRNADATVREFGELLDDLLVSAKEAGIPLERVARLVTERGICLALEAGVPLLGIHDIRAYLEQRLRRALEVG